MSELNKNKILIGVTFHTSLGFHKDVAIQLKRRGYDIHLVSSDGPVLRELSSLVNVHQLEMARQPSLIKDILSLIEWVKLLAEIKPDLVLVGTPKASLLGMIGAKLLGIKIRIYWVHGLRLETATGITRKILYVMERLTAAASTAMFAVSPSLKKQLITMRIARTEKITVLDGGSTQGVNLEAFFPRKSVTQRDELLKKLGLDPALYTIGFVGRLAKEKGVEELKDALVNLHMQGELFQVLILGSVEDEFGQGFIEGLKKAGIGFSAEGHISNVAPYFRAMDLFCLPTYREGLGNVVLEAFATKLPVISTSVTGVIDLVKNEETGLLIPPKDVTSLQAAIVRIIRDQELAEKLGRNALRFVTQNFDSKKVIASQVTFIENALKESGNEL